MSPQSRSSHHPIPQLIRYGIGSVSIASLCLASSCAGPGQMMGKKAGHGSAALNDIATGRPLPSYAQRLDAAKAAGQPGAMPSAAMPPAAMPQVPAAGVQHAVASSHQTMSGIQPLSHSVTVPEPQTGVVRVAGSTSRPWAPDLSGTPTSVPLNDAAIAARLFPAERSLDPVCPPCETGDCRIAPGRPVMMPTENGSDEYVCDGGDRGLPVHYNGDLLAGLDIEDTVAEFSDGEGNRHVRASNQVCVYAPRFGVARAVTDAIEKFTVDRAAGTQDHVQVAGYVARATPSTKADIQTPVGFRKNDQLSSIRNRQADGSLDGEQRVSNHVKLINPFEEYGFVQDGQFRSAERNVIMEAVKAAGEWIEEQSPRAIAKDVNGVEVIAVFDVMELVGSRDMRTPGELRIVKMADRKTAKLGDVVTFTIRFDNLGGKELHQIRILDNLSPRLELIDETVSCDLAGELDVTRNESGGEILTFRLEEALPGKSGGALTFQCRIR